MGVSIKGKTPVKQRRLGATRWTQLRERFVDFRCAGVHKTLEEFAKEEGVPLATLKERSAKEGWFNLIDQRANQLIAMHAEHASEVRQGLKDRLKFDEVEVRTRLANNGEMLENLGKMAIERLLYLIKGDPNAKPKPLLPAPELLDKISPGDAAFVMRIGQELQRKALGLPEKIIEVDINHSVSPAEERFRRQIGNRDKVSAALTDITRILDGEVTNKVITHVG